MVLDFKSDLVTTTSQRRPNVKLKGNLAVTSLEDNAEITLSIVHRHYSKLSCRV